MSKLTDLARRAGRWLSLNRAGGASASATSPAEPVDQTAAVVADRFDQMSWTETYDAAAAVRELADELGERYDYAADLLRDMFYGAYKAAPQVRPTDQMHPGHLVNHKVVSTMLETPEFTELRRETAGDQYAAAMAVLAQGETLRGLLDQTRDAQDAAQRAAEARQQAADAGQAVADTLQHAIDEADQADQGGEGAEGGEISDETAAEIAAAIAEAEQADAAAAAAGQQAQQAVAGAGAAIRAAVRKAAGDAAEQAGAEAALMRAWGIGPGQLQRMSFEQRAELAQRLRGGRLGEFAELIGRFRAMATGERARRVENVPGELVGITLGDDLGRMIPAESANLGVPALRAVFAARLAEQRLMQYETEGEDRAGQGAIIACIDCSGSMADYYGHGPNGATRATGEAWAKACALALLDQAHAASRDFVGILFSSRGEQATFRFPGDQPVAIGGAGGVLEFAETFYGGGTDFESPLGAAAELLAAENNDAGRQRGDIVLITDGAARVGEDWMRAWNDAKHALDFRVFGIAVGRYAARYASAGSVLDALCDNLRSIDDLADTHGSIHAAADLFHTI